METEILESQNLEHGFWGTTRLDYEESETQKRWNIAFIKTMQCALIGMKRFIISDYSTLTNLYHAIIKGNLFTFCQLIYNKKRITIFSQYYDIFNICVNCHSRFGCRF